MKKRFSEAQIIGFLREAEAGLPVKDLCRRHGFSEASYYLWRSKFGGMNVSDAKRLKELGAENSRLKKLLAESLLENEVTREGCVATFQKRQESDGSSWPGSVSCRHLEQVIDELNLSPHIRTTHPPRLPLPDHVHGLVALDRSPRRLKLTKPLLGFHASFDRSMILLQDVVQVLDRPVAATASQESFLFHP